MRAILTVALVGAGTFGLVWCLARVAIRLTGVPDSFPPFTALPLLSGVTGAFMGASLLYALLRLFSANPERLLLFVALGGLAISFALPLRLSFTHSLRFRGVTPAAQMTLALLHTLIATSVVTVLTRTGVLSR